MSSEPGDKGDPLRRYLEEQVVLDTATPILYLGTLQEITESVFVLADADMHDCRDGHANKEKYLVEAHQNGLAVNRRSVIVMRSVVISVSRLADVVAE
jgi:hypothetical protein